MCIGWGQLRANIHSHCQTSEIIQCIMYIVVCRIHRKAEWCWSFWMVDYFQNSFGIQQIKLLTADISNLYMLCCQYIYTYIFAVCMTPCNWHRSKKTSKLHVTGLCEHKGPVTWKMFPFDDVIMIMHLCMEHSITSTERVTKCFGAEMWIFGENYVIVMPAMPVSFCHQVISIDVIYYKPIPAFHKEGFKIPEPSQWWVMIERNIFWCLQNISWARYAIHSHEPKSSMVLVTNPKKNLE